MKQLEKTDILIIGTGPAGMSTALHLLRLDPNWASRMILIDKAVHPRQKLCGGGVTQFAEKILKNNLGMTYPGPSIPIHELRILSGKHIFELRDDPVFRVVRREEFDHWLVKNAIDQGIQIQQNREATDIQVHNEYLDVIAGEIMYRAKVVVAADGSASMIRKQLNWNSGAAYAQALEILTPKAPGDESAFFKGIATFDFSSMGRGLQGYVWDFPSLQNNKQVINRGICHCKVIDRPMNASLKQVFRDSLTQRGVDLDNFELQGLITRLFNINDSFSRPRILLVGDAAGVDPLFGEGISFAFGFGEVAAAQIIDAFSHQDFGMTDYKTRILAHPLLSQLRFRAMGARMLYSLPERPVLEPIMWESAPLLFSLMARFKPRYIPLNNKKLFRLNSHFSD